MKQVKRGRFMPGVKKLFQKSENSSKPECICGYMFGGLGVLASDITKWFCIPLILLLHDGLHPVSSWKQSTVSTASYVMQMMENSYQAAKTFGDSLFLLDRFLSIPDLKRLNELNASGLVRMDLVTKTKKSCTTYMISLCVKGELSLSKIRYMRTPSKATASEATVMCYLRNHIFLVMADGLKLSIMQYTPWLFQCFH